MEYIEAKRLGEVVLKRLEPFIERGEIAGSVRMKKDQCHDVDLVVIPKREFMIMEQIKAILKQYGKLEKCGNEIIIVKDREKETQIDCYMATSGNYEVIRLIRTGSKLHNVKLAKTAKLQEKSLKFGLGLVDCKTGVLLANTEKEIFKELGMEYVEPELRD